MYYNCSATPATLFDLCDKLCAGQYSCLHPESVARALCCCCGVGQGLRTAAAGDVRHCTCHDDNVMHPAGWWRCSSARNQRSLGLALRVCWSRCRCVMFVALCALNARHLRLVDCVTMLLKAGADVNLPVRWHFVHDGLWRVMRLCRRESALDGRRCMNLWLQVCRVTLDVPRCV
jgi:hypothetical protein